MNSFNTWVSMEDLPIFRSTFYTTNHLKVNQNFWTQRKTYGDEYMQFSISKKKKRHGKGSYNFRWYQKWHLLLILEGKHLLLVRFL